MARPSSLKLEYPDSRIPDWFIWKFEIEREREREQNHKLTQRYGQKKHIFIQVVRWLDHKKADHFLSESVGMMPLKVFCLLGPKVYQVFCWRFFDVFPLNA